ncbi:hypothetical protein [Streptomyces sp. NPDC056821]|uniref:hypothetical protein n=1 Tax=unclassified Streptomyces TaxID=2593676 RepID=UPI003699E1CA
MLRVLGPYHPDTLSALRRRDQALGVIRDPGKDVDRPYLFGHHPDECLVTVGPQRLTVDVHTRTGCQALQFAGLLTHERVEASTHHVLGAPHVQPGGDMDGQAAGDRFGGEHPAEVVRGELQPCQPDPRSALGPAVQPAVGRLNCSVQPIRPGLGEPIRSAQGNLEPPACRLASLAYGHISARAAALIWTDP